MGEFSGKFFTQSAAIGWFSFISLNCSYTPPAGLGATAASARSFHAFAASVIGSAGMRPSDPAARLFAAAAELVCGSAAMSSSRPVLTCDTGFSELRSLRIGSSSVARPFLIYFARGPSSHLLKSSVPACLPFFLRLPKTVLSCVSFAVYQLPPLGFTIDNAAPGTPPARARPPSCAMFLGLMNIAGLANLTPSSTQSVSGVALISTCSSGDFLAMARRIAGPAPSGAMDRRFWPCRTLAPPAYSISARSPTLPGISGSHCFTPRTRLRAFSPEPIGLSWE